MSRVEKRSSARLAAVQALYQMDIAAAPMPEVFAEFESFWIGREIEGESYKPAEVGFFRDIVEGVVREQKQIDRDVDATLAAGWPLKRVEAVLRATLRAGTYELMKRPDVPARVVITEYVDVANAFVDKEEAGMANAVLDTLARRLRADEFQPRPEPGQP
jgi:N utilization substance protein B